MSAQEKGGAQAEGTAGAGGEPSEEELRAALEAQLRDLKVRDVVIQTAVTLVNLAGRRLGLGPGSEAERDLEQVRDAIDAVRGLLPVIERRDPETLRPLRDALSQLQLEYAKLSSAQPSPAADAEGQPADSPQAKPSGRPVGGERSSPGPAESSGRLWVPGKP